MTMTPDSAQGRISAMMQRKANRDKLLLLHLVAEYIFGTHYIGGKTGEAITLEAIADLQHELDALKMQLPFLMDIKAGSSSDLKASSIYEDVYSNLCEMSEPHILPAEHGGSSITRDSLCNSIVDNYSALLDFWLATKDETTFELGDHLVIGTEKEDE